LRTTSVFNVGKNAGHVVLIPILEVAAA